MCPVTTGSGSTRLARTVGAVARFFQVYNLLVDGTSTNDFFLPMTVINILLDVIDLYVHVHVLHSPSITKIMKKIAIPLNSYFVYMYTCIRTMRLRVESMVCYVQLLSMSEILGNT